MEHELIQNIALLHTTELGAERVARNLGLSADDVIPWCKQTILQAEEIIREGKNWYVSVGETVITVNAHSYTILTAHKGKKISRQVKKMDHPTMGLYSQEELQEALRAIRSTISKCEKALPKLQVGKSQHTLTVRRIQALQIAVSLISRELQDVYGKESL